MAATRRATKETEALKKNPLAFCTLETEGDDVLHMTARLAGPAGTPYAGGTWTLDVKRPSESGAARPLPAPPRGGPGAAARGEGGSWGLLCDARSTVC